MRIVNEIYNFRIITFRDIGGAVCVNREQIDRPFVMLGSFYYTLGTYSLIATNAYWSNVMLHGDIVFPASPDVTQFLKRMGLVGVISMGGGQFSPPANIPDFDLRDFEFTERIIKISHDTVANPVHSWILERKSSYMVDRD